ncbi:unnamed protein product [Rangifer tarandus platyrhynchus]|uniref:Uncharacterized protein n=2 Tax=Rangifer tarandus platyrhynchus TaxID=3082113 RepID=A0ABN8ZJR8_RANTA|nr:unnamed protein product [Rangifer tarandus platyrhynchus]
MPVPGLLLVDFGSPGSGPGRPGCGQSLCFGRNSVVSLLSCWGLWRRELDLGLSLVTQTVKKSACDVGDPGSIPGSGRTPAEGDDNRLQHPCLGNPMDRKAWRATVYVVAKG